VALLDGPFENRPARFTTDEEWNAWVEAENAKEVLPIMDKRQFTFVGHNENGSDRYEAKYEGGYAHIDYVYRTSAKIVFTTGTNPPNEEELLTEFIDWIWPVPHDFI
jgi:hypothetical protein